MTPRKLLHTGAVLLILIGAGFLFYPFFPLLRYNIASIMQHAPNSDGNDKTVVPLQQLPAIPVEQSGDAARVPVENAADSRLIIPKIGVDIPIVEGRDEQALLRGAWRIPQTSDDPSKGNMAISAHRFRFRPPSDKTFYLLDRLRVGDRFALLWRGKSFTYTVTQVKTVEPNAIEVLDPTPEPTVTLITCTPLFSTAQRLIVVGKLQL